MSANTDLEKMRDELAALRQEVTDLRSGIPFHTHHCKEGHSWRCTSPYCDRIGRDCLEHGGGPLGGPHVNYAIAPEFARV